MNFEYKYNEVLKITGEVKSLKTFIRGISFLEDLPRKCPVCGKPLQFFHKSPSGYEYYGLKCTGDPVHETNFGQKKDGGELYYKNEWEKAYIQKESGQETSEDTSPEPPPPPEYDEDEMPF